MGRSKHQKAKADDNLGKLLSKRVGTTPAARAAIEATENGPRKDQPDQEASVLERNDLSEIIAMADMENRSLRADKNQATVVCDAAGDVTTPEEQERRRIAAQKRYREALKIPRRPQWTREMSTEELEERENESFLQWRRELAALEEEDSLTLTPFEKNLNVWRQLWRVLERSDVVCQIVDARDPLLYRCEDVERYSRELAPNKRPLILLNKADLVPADILRSWSSHFTVRNIPHAFFSATSSESAGSSEGISVICTTEGLLSRFQEEANKSLTASGEASARRAVIGLVGYPNVGKTSTLNAILGRKRAATSATPGKTKHFQTFNVREGIQLADSPGMVFPNFSSSRAELVAASIMPIDRLTDIRSPVGLVAQRIPRKELERGYRMRIPQPAPHESQARRPTASELLEGFAKSRGYVRDGGAPDESRAGREMLKDYVSGRLVYCFEPPEDSDPEERTRGRGFFNGAQDANPDDSQLCEPEEENEQAQSTPVAREDPHEAAEMLAGVRLSKDAMQPDRTRGPKVQEGKEHKKQKKPPRIKGRKMEKMRRKQGVDVQMFDAVML